MFQRILQKTDIFRIDSLTELEVPERDIPAISIEKDEMSLDDFYDNRASMLILKTVDEETQTSDSLLDGFVPKGRKSGRFSTNKPAKDSKVKELQGEFAIPYSL